VSEVTRKAAENPADKVLAQGTVVGLANHTVLVARDGTELPIDDSAAPVRAPGGPLLGVVLVFRDATAERKAQADRARLAAIVESSGDAILSQTVEGKILTWNAAAERLLGYRPEEAVGKSVSSGRPTRRPLPPRRNSTASAGSWAACSGWPSAGASSLATPWKT